MIALDDNIEDHPKFVGLSNDAFALWVRCVGYCRRNLTDGFVPTQAAIARTRCKSPKKPMDELLRPAPGAPGKAPLWSEVPGGYQLHDYLEWNPSRAEVEANREKKRLAGRSGGEASGEARRKRLGLRGASTSEAEGERPANENEAPCFASGSPVANPGSGSGSGSDPGENPPDPPLDLFGEPPPPPEPDPVALVWDTYDAAARAAGHRAFKRSPERNAKVRARIADLGLEAVLGAVRACWVDDWARPGGRCGNPAGRCEPEHVLLNVANCERYARAWEATSGSRAATPTDDAAKRQRDAAARESMLRQKRAALGIEPAPEPS